MSLKTSITAQRLREVLHYEESTGEFHWKVSRQGTNGVGSIAGSINSDGYRVICVDGVVYKAQRLAWLYAHGRWPVGDVDHINGLRGDNALINLREATRTQNIANQRRRRPFPYPRGVTAMRRKFAAHIRRGGRLCHIGMFKTADEAHAAYQQAHKDFYGEYSIFNSQTSTRGANE